MVLWVSFVEPYHDFMRRLIANSLNFGLNTCKWRKIIDLFIAQIYTVYSPVLVSILVLQINDVLICECPPVITYSSVCIIGDWRGHVRLGGRTDPNVHDTI